MTRTIFLAAITVLILWAIPAYADSVILPHRVIDARTKTVIDFEGLLSRCSGADVVTLGENHDDPATHMIEFAMLEGLFRHDGNVIFSMEMFERDCQEILTSYLAGEITEEEFLAGSRPWGNYETDYRPMVEFAAMNGIPVIASNVPRPLASRIVMSEGFENAEYSDEELPWIASTFEAPEDGYWEAFAAVMGMVSTEGMNVPEESVRYFYESQVLKDETMAESVSRAFMENPDSLVYHIAGAFHLENNLGTFSRIERNIPDADCVSIRVIPVDDLLAPLPKDTPYADYWILVLAPELEEEEMMEMPVMPVMPPPTDE